MNCGCRKLENNSTDGGSRILLVSDEQDSQFFENTKYSTGTDEKNCYEIIQCLTLITDINAVVAAQRRTVRVPLAAISTESFAAVPRSSCCEISSQTMA